MFWRICRADLHIVLHRGFAERFFQVVVKKEFPECFLPSDSVDLFYRADLGKCFLCSGSAKLFVTADLRRCHSQSSTQRIFRVVLAECFFRGVLLSAFAELICRAVRASCSELFYRTNLPSVSCRAVLSICSTERICPVFLAECFLPSGSAELFYTANLRGWH